MNTGQLLRVIEGAQPGEEIPLGNEFRIGRGAGDSGNLELDPELSRRHARIERSQDGTTLTLEDLGSTNGTYLNGWRIPSPQPMSAGDRVRVGRTVLELIDTRVGTSSAVTRRRAVLADTHPAEPAPPSSVLRAEGVKKSYGDIAVLHGVDLEVQPGEIVGLLGHNGAGKTTFVSIVAGLRSADEGSVVVNGVDALKHPIEARRHLGLAPQELGIYVTLSVRRNLQFFGELAGLAGRELEQRVHEIGEALSLTPLFDRPAGVMSGGEKRRLHTAMAMLHDPPLLILDEPTVGADVRTRQEILDTVKRAASEGRGVIYSTHYLPEIEELGASVAILQGGRILARGVIAELIAKHSAQAAELHFDGEPPDLGIRRAVHDGSTIRILSDEPEKAAAAAMARLGDQAHRLLGVEIVRPSLDSVYLGLTEERYSDVHDRPAGVA